MRKHFIILIVASLVMIATNSVDAQTYYRFVIDIPFDFIVEGRILPAGKYTLERLDPTKPNVLLIKNTDNRMMRVFLTQRVGGDGQTSRTSSLVFRLRGGNAYLFQVWASEDTNGHQLSPGDEIQKLDRRDNSTLVKVRANTKSP